MEKISGIFSHYSLVKRIIMEYIRLTIYIGLGLYFIISAPFVFMTVFRSIPLWSHLRKKHGLLYFFIKGNPNVPGEVEELEKYRRMMYIQWMWGIAFFLFIVLLFKYRTNLLN